MKIEAIVGDEVNSIRALWESLNAHHLSRSTHFKDHFSKLTFEKRMEDLKKKDHLICCVAKGNSEKIGYCIATADGLVGEIDSLFVAEPHRGKRVGEQLMSFAFKWLEAQGCETIKVSIAEGNEKVLEFYRRFGFKERFMVMQKNGLP